MDGLTGMSSRLPFTFACLLRKTLLPEPFVWSLLGAVVLAAILLLRNPAKRPFRRGFIVLSIAWFASAAILAAADIRLYQLLTEENHLIEWLTADVLLVASCIVLAAAVRSARRGRPLPMGVFLWGGFFLAFARELEWGQPFFGAKAWYSRNLFRLRAYLDPGYFVQFRAKYRLPESAEFLYQAHLIISVIFIVLVVLAGWYVLWHWRDFLSHLRRVPRESFGRYFLLGAAVYIAAQPLGRLFERLLTSPLLLEWRKANHLGHRILDEPLELWAAVCFLWAAIVFWKAHCKHQKGTAP